MSHKERKIEKCNLCANSPWEKWGLPPGSSWIIPAPPLPLFFSQNFKGPRGNRIDNGQFNWILFLFFQADGKGSYRIAFVWAGFIRPLESPTKNALNAICSDSDSIHLQHHQISSLNLDVRSLYIYNFKLTKLINYVANWYQLLLRTVNIVKNVISTNEQNVPMFKAHKSQMYLALKWIFCQSKKSLP